MAPKQTTYDPNDSAVNVRDSAGDGLFSLTAPISSSAIARDGQRFSTERLAGFRDQINSGEQPVPLMVDHGKSDFGGEARYSILGRIGTVDSAELETDGDTTLLHAEMSVADPDALAEEGDTGEIEAALRWLRFQAETMGLSFSVGWDEDGGRVSEVDADAEIVEVSAVATPSDVQASTASAEPTETAVRGFEALASSADTRPPADIGFRGYEPPEPTDEERVAEALDALEHVREHHTQPDDVPAHKRREETPPALATIDEIRRQFGHDTGSAELAERLADIQGESTRQQRRREDVLARLETVEDHAPKLARPKRTYNGTNPHEVRFPFGRSHAASRERITDAVETLRDVLTDSEEFHGWGMTEYLEGS